MFSRSLIAANTDDHDAAEVGRLLDPPQKRDEFDMTPLEVSAILGNSFTAAQNIEDAKRTNTISPEEEVKLWMLLACGQTLYRFKHGGKYLQRAIAAAKKVPETKHSPWFMRWSTAESALLELGNNVDLKMLKSTNHIDTTLYDKLFDKFDTYQVSEDADKTETTVEPAESGKAEDKIDGEDKKVEGDNSTQDEEDVDEGEILDSEDSGEDSDDDYEPRCVMPTVKFDRNFFLNNKELYICALACAGKLLGDNNWYILRRLVTLTDYDFISIRVGLKIYIHCAEKMWYLKPTPKHLLNRRYLYTNFLHYTGEVARDEDDIYWYTIPYFQRMAIIAIDELFMKNPLDDEEDWDDHREILLLIITYLLSHTAQVYSGHYAAPIPWRPEMVNYINKMVNASVRGNTIMYFMLTKEVIRKHGTPLPHVCGNDNMFGELIEDFLTRGFNQFYLKNKYPRKSVMDAVYALEVGYDGEREYIEDQLESIRVAADKYQPAPTECKLLSTIYYADISPPGSPTTSI
jgi:hypothetical protein